MRGSPDQPRGKNLRSFSTSGTKVRQGMHGQTVRRITLGEVLKDEAIRTQDGENEDSGTTLES